MDVNRDDRREQVPNTPFNKQDEEQLSRFKSTGFLSNFENSNWENASQTKRDTSEEPWLEVLNGTKLNFTSLLALQDQASGATAFRNDDYQLESNGLWSDNFRHKPQNEIDESMSHKSTNEMAPDTPEKIPRSDAQIQNLCTNSRAHEETKTNSELQELAKDSVGAVSAVITGNGNDVETPQQKPRRRKHRPKVITEGKPRIRKPATPKPTTPAQTQTGKRKYVRKEPLDKIPESTGKRKCVEEKLLDENAQAPTSARRSLNFDNERPSGYVGSECKPNYDEGSQLQEKDVSGGHKSKLNVNFGQGIEVVVEPTCDLSCYIDQMRQKHYSSNETLPAMNSMPEKRAPNVMSHFEKILQNGEFQKNHEVRGDQVNTHYAHHKGKDVILYTSIQRKTNASNWGNRSNMGREVKQNRTEWENYRKSYLQDTCSTNISGIYYNSNYAYKTVLGQNSTASSKSCLTSLKDTAKQGITGVLRSNMQSILAQMEGPTKKRSRTPTRLRDVASLTKIARGVFDPNSLATWSPVSYNVHQAADQYKSHARVDALAAEIHKQLRTKKRTKGGFPLVNDKSANTIEQSPGKIMLTNRNQYSPMLLGNSLDDRWMSPIIRQLQQLDINRETSAIEFKEHNALVPYSYSSIQEQQNALVLYRRDGTVVPFTGEFQPIRKRRMRPKVDLDQETGRVWRLLLENINSQGIDGTDEEKAKWWKEEREVFSGRAHSFIARMHLVQGDRHFTPWKGSVVDSVVGVFLTQNVSDHLSSSAYMSMAANFPLKPTSHEAMREPATEKPIVCMPDLEDAIDDMSNKSICSELDEESDADYSNESSMSSTAIIQSTSGVEEYYHSAENRSTTDVSKTINACHIEGIRSITNDAVSSQNSVVSSQNSADSPIPQTGDRNEFFSHNNPETDQIDGSKHNCLNSSNTFTELLMKAGRKELHEVPSHGNGTFLTTQNLNVFGETQNMENEKCSIDSSKSSLELFMAQHLNSELKVVEETRYPDISENNVSSHIKEQVSFTSESANHATDENNLNHSTHEASRYITVNDSPRSNIKENMHLDSQSQVGIAKDLSIVEKSDTQAGNNDLHKNVIFPNLPGKDQYNAGSGRGLDILEKDSQKTPESELNELGLQEIKELAAKRKAKGRRVGGEIRDDVDWDALRKETESNGRKREKTLNTMDSVNWEAVRCADVNKIADTIKDRGMNNVLAGRIKDFLNRLVRDHGSIDLEWLRDVPPDKAKEYLLTIRGLGLKSVECVRLLTLHHVAFPVDTNVGRIAVRLGWVPLQPLPESLQLHLLELYPVQESIQQYLWPRLCKLDQKTLYELHYQMITFGKVFCTKSKPNCNACPMRGECRHFASAFASARLALPEPEEKSIVNAAENRTNEPNPAVMVNQLRLPLPQPIEKSGENQQFELKQLSEINYEVKKCEPIVEEPSSPEQECTQVTEIDIEDTFREDPDEIPTIKLNIEEFTQNLQTYMQNNMELQEGEMSKALVALNEEAASIPMPKLKNVSQLRTEHHVYELPDSHPLLQGLDKREPDDPCSYLLAIWTPGETPNSIQPPESTCSMQEYGKLCDETTCFSCNSIREANSQIVRGTLLIPCRTAMRGSFPLNGTYFQVNEVFADHDSSLNPIDVPRSWIWNLPRRTVYFGTSIPTIFKGLTTEGIQQCFWRGYVCVRGFDQKTRAPRPLLARLHFPASKLNKTKVYDR